MSENVARPVGKNGEILLRGSMGTGIEARVGPVASADRRFSNRGDCLHRGLCRRGCKVNAKASPLIIRIADAIALQPKAIGRGSARIHAGLRALGDYRITRRGPSAL
jgi:hypothetical protein